MHGQGGHNTAMHMAQQAAHRAQVHSMHLMQRATRRMQVQANNRTRLDSIKFGRMQANRAQTKARQQRFEEYQESLIQSVSRPLICHARPYAEGAALFCEHNWKDKDGAEQVVFLCNTFAPRSGKPIVAFLWTGAGVEPVDFLDDTIAQTAARGRLFIFPGNVDFQTGYSYAVVPATFQEKADGVPGIWSFATAGLFRGELFLTGVGGLGAFTNPARSSMLVARPFLFDAKQCRWVWAGRSTQNEGSKLRLITKILTEHGPESNRTYLVPPNKPGGDTVFAAATEWDAQGDPLCVMNTKPQPTYGVSTINGKPYFVARPNHRDSKGRLLFAGKAVLRDGQDVFISPYLGRGDDAEVELPANHRDKSGAAWFMRYANAKDKHSGQPVVLIQLEAL